MVLNSDTTIKNMVYQKVVELICSGQFETGTFITERQLMELFGVSKSPVREALLQLCLEGTLNNIPRCGYQIIPISVKNIHELTELRLILELHCIEKVSANITAEQLEALKLLMSARHDKNKDIWMARSNNVKFHMFLAELANNAMICSSLEKAFTVCTRAYAQLYTSQRQVLDPENGHCHDLLLQALEAHDSSAAKEYLKQDILLMEQQLLDYEKILSL